MHERNRNRKGYRPSETGDEVFDNEMNRLLREKLIAEAKGDIVSLEGKAQREAFTIKRNKSPSTLTVCCKFVGETFGGAVLITAVTALITTTAVYTIGFLTGLDILGLIDSVI